MVEHSVDRRKPARPEDIIIGTDPVSIDILKQIYSAINDIGDERRSFLERCWFHGIERAYKNPSVKLDPDLCFRLLEQIYHHLENKDVWEVKEEDLCEIFEKIISLKATRDSGLKEVFDHLEKSLTATLQLDFSHKIPLTDSFKDKRNIFNYFVLLFNAVMEKMELSMVSAKAVNTYFSKYPDTAFIITDNLGKIRFVNQTGEQLLGLEGARFLGLEIKDFIRNYPVLIEKFNKKGAVEAFQTEIMPLIKNAEPISVTISIPEPVKDRSEIDEKVFIIQFHTPYDSFTHKQPAINEMVSIKNLVEEIIGKIKLTDKWEDIEIENNIFDMRPIKSNYNTVYRMFENLLYSAAVSRKPFEKTKLIIDVKEKKGGVVFIFQDTKGRVTSILASLKKKVNRQTQVQNTEQWSYNKAKECVEILGGEMELFSSASTGTTITGFLPCCLNKK